MNGKIVAAFISGAVLASGIVYMAVRPTALPQVADLRPVELPPLPPPSQPAVVETAAPVQSAAPQSKPEPVIRAPKTPALHAHLSQKPIHEKPSPISPRHQDQATVASNNTVNTEPLHPSAPQPPEPPQTVATPVPPALSAPVTKPEPTPVQPPIVVASSPVPQLRQAPEIRLPHTVVLQVGTQLMVRIGETLSAARNQIGDTFFATLEQPLVIDGFIICERGSRVIGKVTQATPAGRAGGQSHLSLELTRLNTSDRQRIEIRTEPYSRDGLGSVGGDFAKIGVGTAIGAAIGGIAGGGRGAAIGAGAGAAAGAGLVLVSNGTSVQVPVEARITFRVKEPTTITEKLD